MNATARDPVICNDWHPVAGCIDLPIGRVHSTVLLDTPIAVARRDEQTYLVWLDPEHRCRHHMPLDAAIIGPTLPATLRYGHLWTSIDEPRHPLFSLPEADEAGRRPCHPGSIGVHTGGLRAIENFLDLAHFPFVPTPHQARIAGG